MTKDNFIRLYKNHKNGKIGYWEGWTEDNVVIMQYAAGLNDSPQVVTETVTEGKQGRSTIEQTFFRLSSRVSSKIDSGYVESYDEAMDPPTDANGNKKPMLAQKFRDYNKPIDDDRAYVQLKYNGHRALIFRHEDHIVVLSRNGKEIPGVPHIQEQLKNLEYGTVLDGEIYHHGWRLQQIASAAKRYQIASKSLNFICYDTISERPFSQRLETIRALNTEGQFGDIIKVAPTRLLSQVSDINSTMKKALDAGYEGLILRLDGMPYESGRRSSQLLKIKHMHDDEFQVIDVLRSKDDWGILVCHIPTGGSFKVSAPGSIPEKKHVLDNKNKYIGKLVTVEYSELTEDGVPFHPVAISFRDDL